MQHIGNLAEDKSYPQKERSKFKGWYLKWTMGRIPVLVCLALEVLSPAKILSKTFQNEDVDPVATVSLLNQVKQQLRRIERKDFEQLPTVKRFLDRVTEEDGSYVFHDVKLKQFQQGKETGRRYKDEWVQLITEAIEKRLESHDSAADIYAPTILNTEAWVRNDEDKEFGVEALSALYDVYKSPLESAGFSGSLSDLIEQWEILCHYTLQYLAPTTTDYRVVWRKIFQSSRRSSWKLVLLLVELLFSLPMSNAKVERMFSLMNRIKTDSRSSLSKEVLSALIRICMEGPECADFDAISSMTLWNDVVKARRPSQKKQKREYKQREKKSMPTTLVDESSSSEDETR